MSRTIFFHNDECKHLIVRESFWGFGKAEHSSGEDQYPTLMMSTAYQHESKEILCAEPAQRTEDQTNQIAILRRALGQVQQHQAKVKEDMIYARNEVS